jgi:hypothetical protein
MLINVIIIICNWLYTGLTCCQNFAFLAKSPTVVKHAFKIGWAINIYWLLFGWWFAWYGNIAITVYFVFLNWYGNRQWGNKPIKSTKLPYIALSIGIALTLAVNIYTNQLWHNIPSTINCFNSMLYAVTYTLFAMGAKYQRLAQKLKLINLVAYIPMVCMVQPILYGCAIRQTFMVGLYVYKLWGKQIHAYCNKYAIAKLQYATVTW